MQTCACIAELNQIQIHRLLSSESFLQRFTSKRQTLTTLYTTQQNAKR